MWINLKKEIMFSAYQQCWPNAKLDFNMELCDKIKPDVYNSEKHDDLIDNEIQIIEKKISESPKNFSTQSCTALRAQAFSRDEDKAVHAKLEHRLEQLDIQW